MGHRAAFEVVFGSNAARISSFVSLQLYEDFTRCLSIP
jgi:hypothetical protein